MYVRCVHDACNVYASVVGTQSSDTMIHNDAQRCPARHLGVLAGQGVLQEQLQLPQRLLVAFGSTAPIQLRTTHILFQ